MSWAEHRGVHLQEVAMHRDAGVCDVGVTEVRLLE